MKNAVPALFASALFLFLFQSVTPAQAEAAKDPKEEATVVYQEITGTVTGISRQGIGIEYARSKDGASEIFLPVTDKTRFERLSSVTELKPGDTVKVRYQQTYKDQKDKSRVILGRVATDISLWRRAPKEALVSGGSSE